MNKKGEERKGGREREKEKESFWSVLQNPHLYHLQENGKEKDVTFHL